MVTDPDQISYAKNDAEMRDRWRKRIKYELLELASEKTKLEGKAAPRTRSRSATTSLAKRMKQTDDDELLEMYLTALTTAYDPHTTYMSADTLENFEIQMRLNLEGIGAALEAARRRNGRQEDHSRRRGRQGRPAEARRPDRRRRPGRRRADRRRRRHEAQRRGQADPRPPGHDGPPGRCIPKGETEPKIYNIVRQQIELTDSEARSEILEAGKKPDGTPYKIGVINLPSFYMDMSGARSGRDDFKSTTRDVAKLLKDFNAKKVDAVVLDLRHNGGGSLTEAINLTGLVHRQRPGRAGQGLRRPEDSSTTTPSAAWPGPARWSC